MRPQALELGYDAVLLNTAIAKAADPVAMANAFRLGVEAGRTAYEAGLMEARDFASPSTPVDRDPVLACRILIDSIPSSTASPGWRAWRCSASAPSSCAPRTSTMPRRCRSSPTRSRSSRARDAKLVVNDYWRAAIVAGAKHLHLGQEDLADADLGEIREAGLTLGISTHDDEELATALAAKPDYVALGPIFPTTLKSMRFAPQGIPKITEWKKRIGDIPLVAIGGIKFEQAAEIFAAGADSIAVVSDVTQNADPDARVRQWLGAKRGGRVMMHSTKLAPSLRRHRPA